jgi:hypothetical protein
MANTKTVQYLNRDFDSLKAQLINFAKIYYPNTYNDFSEASPGMMLIEMASYVGDVLSFYTDNQIQENFLQFAKQRKNLLALAYNFGYTPKVTSAASVEVSVFQVVPSTIVNSQYVPDFGYALILEEGTQLQTNGNGNVAFYIDEKIDFSNSGSSPIDTSVYSYDISGNPLFYLLQKTAKATAGTLTTTTFTFGNPERFPTVTITDNNVISIVGITDSDSNKWYEVPYLAQDTIFEATENTATNDPSLAQYNDSTPYLLKLKKVPRRFVSRFKTNNTLELQFGPGVSSGADEEIVPNPDNIGLGLPYGVDKMMTAWDPSNFLYTQTYGLAPANTTLTVTYLKGGGAASNIPSNTLTNRIGGTNSFAGSGLDATMQATVLNSLAFTNDNAAVGGGDGDTNEEIRQNALAMYPTQLRTITNDDYIIRTLSLPSKYGLISKAFVTQDMGISVNYPTDLLATQNPNAISIYVLSRNSTGNLTVSSPALKQNIQTFLSEYRMLTDGVNIKDAFIINIGVNFDVVVRPNYNGKLVINNCLTVLQSYFNIDQWQINQPILIADIYSILDQVEGVQTVQKVDIVNKAGTNSGYSQYAYDIKGATINNILYPSLDPSIFEVKNLTTDIQGRVVTF